MKVQNNDIINKIFFTIVFILVFFISCVFTSGIPGENDGISVCADLLLAASIVTGILYENRKAASVIALVFGVVSDVLLTPPVHLSPLMFFVAAYFAQKVAGVFTSVNVATAAVASIPFFLARAVVGCVYVISENEEAKLSYIIKNITLPELAFNVTAVFILYIVIGFTYNRVKRRFYI